MMFDSDDLIPADPDMGARLIDAAGTDRFGDMLLAQAQRIGGIEELFCYAAGGDGQPHRLVSRSVLPGAAERVATYSARFFRHDPALRRTVGRPVPPRGFCRRVRAGEIVPHDYRRLCFDAPRFAEKLSFGWSSDAGLLMLSFYSAREMEQATVRRLARLADVALAAQRRLSLPQSRDGMIVELERRLCEARPELTLRERQVCARSIAGWTTDRIAADLAVAAASVFTYRRRACQRYGVRSAAEFLSAILR